jgi:ribonuclease BN (tRNA processing enzyme)
MSPRPISSPLTLENSGHLSVFSLGTGGAFTKKLYQNNYLIIKGNQHVLIDCGTKATQAMVELGLAPTQIHTLLITHSHADHVGGLEELALMGRYITKQKPKMIITETYEQHLWNNSLKGGCAYNERSGNKLLAFEDLFHPIRPRPYSGLQREAWEIELNDLNLILFRTKHIPDSSKTWKDSGYSLGCIVDRRFFFSGDTRFDHELVEDVMNHFPIEIAFHDVQFFPGGVHASFDELCTLPDSFKAKCFLMHYPDTYKEKEQLVKDQGFLGFVQPHAFYDFI